VAPGSRFGQAEWYPDEFGRLLKRAGLRRITLAKIQKIA
jgi:hypothetical protein